MRTRTKIELIAWLLIVTLTIIASRWNSIMGLFAGILIMIGAIYFFGKS